MLFLAMSVIWGIPYLFIKIAVAEMSPVAGAFTRIAVASLVLLPVAISRGSLAGLRQKLGWLVALAFLEVVVPFPLIAAGEQRMLPGAGVLASLLILGVICTAAGFILFFSLVAAAGPSRATVITYVNPVVAVALGVAVLGEPVTAATVAGFLLIIAGCWLSTGGTPPSRRGVAQTLARWATRRPVVGMLAPQFTYRGR